MGCGPYGKSSRLHTGSKHTGTQRHHTGIHNAVLVCACMECLQQGAYRVPDESDDDATDQARSGWLRWQWPDAPGKQARGGQARRWCCIARCVQGGSLPAQRGALVVVLDPAPLVLAALERRGTGHHAARGRLVGKLHAHHALLAGHSLACAWVCVWRGGRGVRVHVIRQVRGGCQQSAFDTACNTTPHQPGHAARYHAGAYLSCLPPPPPAPPW